MPRAARGVWRMTRRAVFFCGHRSRYGAAHLDSVLKEFDISAVVVATDSRWEIFQRQLSGTSHQGATVGGILMTKLKSAARRTLSRFSASVALNPSQDVETICSRRGVPVLRTHDVNESSFVDSLRQYRPTWMLGAAYPQIFSKKLLSVPEQGSINFHPSLLPRCRGAHPVFWAIASGESRSGMTSHYMTEKIDDGAIISQLEFPISDYYYSDLYGRIVKEVPGHVRLTREFLADPQRQPTRQNPEAATYFRNDREVHRRIFWNLQSAAEIHNLVRTEVAYCFFRNQKLGIRRATLAETNRNLTNKVKVEPGTIVDMTDECIAVKTNDACLNATLVSKDGQDQAACKWAELHCVTVGEKLN